MECQGPTKGSPYLLDQRSGRNQPGADLDGLMESQPSLFIVEGVRIQGRLTAIRSQSGFMGNLISYCVRVQLVKKVVPPL